MKWNAPAVQRPDPADLPSLGALFRATIVAVVVAAAIIVGVVLPAERAIDLTGFGRITKLQEMGEIKMEAAEEFAAEAAAEAAKASTRP
jgi:hypothetical protein